MKTKQQVIESLRLLRDGNKVPGSRDTINGIIGYYSIRFGEAIVSQGHLEWLLLANGVPSDYRELMIKDVFAI